MLTHRNLVSNVTMCSAWLYKCKRGEEIMLGVIPFFHVYGVTTVMILSVMQAYKMVLLPKFDVETTLKTIHKERPTLFPGAPTIYIGILNDPKLSRYDLSSIDSCLSGSAPLPVEVQEEFEVGNRWQARRRVWINRIRPYYPCQFFVGSSKEKGKRWRSMARHGCKNLIIRNIGTASSWGNWGNCRKRTTSYEWLLESVLKKPEKVLKEGWLLTGDLGYMDEDGYFYVVDRKKDMIIAGGFNVYPREVEEVLYEHPDVQEVVVVGIPDPYRGETCESVYCTKRRIICFREGIK